MNLNGRSLPNLLMRVLPLLGLGNLGAIGELVRRFGPQIQTILRTVAPLLEQLLRETRATAAGSVAQAVDDEDVPDPQRPPLPAAAEPRRIAGLRGHWWFGERKNQPYMKGGGRKEISKEEFREIMSGRQGAQAGDRMHADFTPTDQFGHDFLPGQDVNRLLLDDQGNPAIVFVPGDPLEETSRDDFGMTPVFLVPWERPDIRPGYQGAAGVDAALYVKDGHAVRPEQPHDTVYRVTLPPFRIRPWAHPSLDGKA